MTEAEFNKRLLALLQKNPQVQMHGMDGLADIFSSIKNTIVSVGSSLVSGVKTLGSTLAKGAKSTLSVFSGDTGKQLLETAGTVFVAKTTMDIAKSQAQAQAASNQNSVATALAAQGINVNSPEGQALLRDVANSGIVGAGGQTLFPAANPYARSSGFFNMETLQPILIAAVGLLAFSFIVPKGSKHAR